MGENATKKRKIWDEENSFIILLFFPKREENYIFSPFWRLPFGLFWRLPLGLFGRLPFGLFGRLSFGLFGRLSF
jgi:hypothetical protein